MIRQQLSDGYYTPRSWKDGPSQPRSPTWVHPASSPATNFPSVSLSSMSSRGSWSSLFNTNNVRQLIGSGIDTARDSGHSLSYRRTKRILQASPCPETRRRKFSDVDSPTRLRPTKSDSPQRHTPALRLLPDVGAARMPGTLSPLALQGARPTFSQVARAKQFTVHKSIEVKDSQRELQEEMSVFLLFAPEQNVLTSWQRKRSGIVFVCIVGAANDARPRVCGSPLSLETTAQAH
jgi:hypothetical protein